ncbi:SDR family NAD(P)-dependent oxidoreductase [Roseomonas sp. CECT 9278]|uniref:SDR family NAD(P)-dependent oxidoreductase n=1 Tax=Roseomonas sp. CECT 9278 TaxID=2845823 RepID=UPI001E310712|nr:SDR family oxidoreductase [Roseomonas sp. CECT 9278]CAH0303443.1 3-oxoacyl-[acyl-carrier-protein] reductase FabG [Roseomonas sp. CECT 9278]
MTVRTALVTGAQQGIGAAAARALAMAGHDVAINWLDDQAAAEAVAADVRAAGRRAVLLQGSVGTATECAALVQGAIDALGRIDVLVNNAGIFPRVEFLDMTEAEWDRVLDVNLKGSAFCAQAAARHMVAAGIQGVILNLSSSSVRGAVLGVHYSATKTGIIGITRSMALALAPHGIRVNAIAPGLTDTAQPRHGNTDAELAEMAKALPLGRMGRPEEIAGLMTYLASDAAAWITGQVYHINGGVYLA